MQGLHGDGLTLHPIAPRIGRGKGVFQFSVLWQGVHGRETSGGSPRVVASYGQSMHGYCSLPNEGSICRNLVEHCCKVVPQIVSNIASKLLGLE